ASQQYQQRVFQQRQRQKQRRTLLIGSVAIGLALVVFETGRSYYNHWVETRPWARVVNLSTGQIHDLMEDTALVGRPTKGMEGVKYQVRLERRRGSPIHLSFSRGADRPDCRTLLLPT